MPRHLRVRPNPAVSFIGGVFALFFVAIGIFVVIPLTGWFGVVWTLFAAVGAGTGFYNAISKRGLATQIVEVSDDRPLLSNDPESRLRTLEDLRAKSLITPAEYEQRRSEIVRQI